MSTCATCGRVLGDAEAPSGLRSGELVYHLGCAPTSLVEAASEEHRAILRKGLRYFVEKYSADPASVEHSGERFVELGRAVEAERGRRS